jgi:hypothetical protein
VVATTQAGGKVEVNGSSAGDETDGLHITAGHAGIEGLTIQHFKGSGIQATGSLWLKDVAILDNGKTGIDMGRAGAEATLLYPANCGRQVSGACSR